MDKLTYWKDCYKDSYKHELQLICDNFCDIIYPILHKNYLKIRKQFYLKIRKHIEYQKLFKKYRLNPDDTILPKNFYIPEEFYLDMWSEEFLIHKNSYERVCQITFANIVMIWEQQLYDYLSHIKDIKNDYKILKEKCSEYTNINLNKDIKIQEIRDVVNVIKHGIDGTSYKSLISINSKFLNNKEKEDFSEIDNRLLVVKITPTKIKEITKRLISFWSSIKIIKTY